MKYLYGQKILITGGNSGIGKAIAETLSDNGYIVYAASRHLPKNNNPNITYLKMDVTDEASIRQAYENTPEDLSVIIHAAGFGIAGPAEEMPIQKAKDQMETNYFGVLRVNQIFLPRLRKNGKSLIIAISSIGGKVALPYQSQYSASKYALEAHIEALGIEIKRFGVRTCLIEPGDTRTGFTANRIKTISQNSPYREYFDKAISQIEHDELSGDSPNLSAQTVLKVLKNPNPPVRIAIGTKYKALMFLLRIMPDKMTDYILEKLYHA